MKIEKLNNYIKKKKRKYVYVKTGVLYKKSYRNSVIF